MFITTLSTEGAKLCQSVLNMLKKQQRGLNTSSLSAFNFVYRTEQSQGGWTLLTHKWWNVMISAGGSITAQKLPMGEKNYPPEKLLHNERTAKGFIPPHDSNATTGYDIPHVSQCVPLRLGINQTRTARPTTTTVGEWSCTISRKHEQHEFICTIVSSSIKATNVVSSHFGLIASWQKTLLNRRVWFWLQQVRTERCCSDSLWDH